MTKNKKVLLEQYKKNRAEYCSVKRILKHLQVLRGSGSITEKERERVENIVFGWVPKAVQQLEESENKLIH